MACTTGKKSLAFGITGLILIILGVIIGWVVVPSVVRSQIADILVLNKDSESWDRWASPPVPIQFRIYIFDIQNPNEIVKGEKPVVVEKGPYVYGETRNKIDIELDADDSTVKYKQHYNFIFDQKASGNLSEDDRITVLNTVAVGFALITDNLKEINDIIIMFESGLRKMWDYEEHPLFHRTTVKDYLFGELPMYCNQSIELHNIDTLLLCEAFKLVNPRPVKLDNGKPYFNTFSFFRYKNDTDDGIFEMDSGHESISNIGNIKTWQGKSTLHHWKGKSCNTIRGSDSTIFRPYLEMDDVQTVSVFNTDICRYINLTYEEDVEFKGVTGRRYVGDKTVFGSVLDNNENYCYCPPSIKGITNYGGCLKSGLLDVGTCLNAPIIVSHPHFLMADSSLRENIEGLNPDEEKHKIFLDLEPYTGYPLQGASRVQINIFLKRIKEVESMKNMPNVLMPVLWIEETVKLTDDLIDDLNDQLFDKLMVADILKYSIIALGVVLGAGACIFYFVKTSKEKEVV